MPQLKREQLPAKLNKIIGESDIKVFLFYGERFLCRSAADEAEEALLAAKAGTVSVIDGDQEDMSQTLSKLLSFSLLPGTQLYRVNDTRLFLSRNTGKSIWQKAHKAGQAGNSDQAVRYLNQLLHAAGLTPDESSSLSQFSEQQWQQSFGFSKPDDTTWAEELLRDMEPSGKNETEIADISGQYIEAFSRGLPADNILFLTAENVDKRKKLFSYIKEHGLVVDCSVAEGSGSAVQKVQKSVLLEMMQKTLDEYGKKIAPGALDKLFERIGFHPVAVVMETEKLALFCADRPQITLNDIDAIVGRSREDALFELTDHFGKHQLAKTLTTLHHLQEHGIHGLAILATLRNYVRRLLIFRSLQYRPAPVYRKGMSAKQFQDNYLPELKQLDEWSELLKGHPYALYMNFTKAAEFSCTRLKRWLEMILEADYRLKGSGIDENIILENLIISMMQPTERTPR